MVAHTTVQRSVCLADQFQQNFPLLRIAGTDTAPVCPFLLRFLLGSVMPEIGSRRQGGTEAVNNTSGYHMSAGCGGGRREGRSKGRRPIIDDAVWQMEF